MKIWLVQHGEPLPIDGLVRLYRTGTLAAMLAERGHDVTWWTPTFSHFQKKQRYLQDQTIELGEHYRLELLYARGYLKNISLARILHHRQLARQFADRISTEPPPDIILCGFPTAEMSSVALKYAKRWQIPILLDVRDHWPDYFLTVVPPSLRWLARLALWPTFRANRRIFSEVTGIIGVSFKQLYWGLAYAGRQQQKIDQVFYHGYPGLAVSSSDKQKARQTWQEQGVCDDKFNCCYFGAISQKVNLDTIIAAARELAVKGNDNFQFILCGNGSRLERYRQLVHDLSNVILPGWVNAAEIAVLMEWSKVGLAPFVDKSMSLPNKPCEYFYGGLPVLSSVRRGELEQLLAEHNCGITYDADDVQGFLGALHQLYNNSHKQQLMGQNARRLFEERFSADRIYPAMIDYLEQVANGELGR